MKQDFVILPRDQAELALASLEYEFGKRSKSASDIRAALDQPVAQEPLTDEQINAVVTEQWGSKVIYAAHRAFARAAIAKAEGETK